MTGTYGDESETPLFARKGYVEASIFASIDASSSSSSSIVKLPSIKPKRLVNQITIVERRMIVPAFLMNDQPRFHIERRTFPTVGRWYAGSLYVISLYFTHINTKKRDRMKICILAQSAFPFFSYTGLKIEADRGMIGIVKSISLLRFRGASL